MEFDLLRLKRGSVIYVSNAWPSFLREYSDTIEYPYILLCNFCQHGVSAKILPYLEGEKLLFCLSQNPRIIHPKVIPIPVGVNPGERGKNLEVLEKVAEQLPSIEKKHLVYLNCCLGTCVKERQRVYTLFQDAPYVYLQQRKGFDAYLYDLASSEFVFSPRGLSEDCYRTWEALYMGAIPIVKSSCLDPLFEDLPVLIVKDWDEISEEFLLDRLAKIRKKSYSMDKITPEYWRKLIKGK